MSALKPRPPSEAGTDSSWEMDGRRWLNKRAQSEPTGVTTVAMNSENLKRMQHEAALAEERKKEQDTDLQTPPSRKWRRSRSPPSSRTPDQSRSSFQIVEEGKEEYEKGVQDEPGEARFLPLPEVPSPIPRATITPGVIAAQTGQLFERRTTITTTTTPSVKSPSGAASSATSAVDQGLNSLFEGAAVRAPRWGPSPLR